MPRRMSPSVFVLAILAYSAFRNCNVDAKSERLLTAQSSVVREFDTTPHHIFRQLQVGDYEIHRLNGASLMEQFYKYGDEAPETIELSMLVMGEPVVFTMKPVLDAFHPDFKHHFVSESGESTISADESNSQCLFQGKIKGDATSRARFSFCELVRNESVISGSFRFQGTRYAVQPLREETSGPVHHVLYPTKKIASDGTCGNEEQESHHERTAAKDKTATETAFQSVDNTVLFDLGSGTELVEARVESVHAMRDERHLQQVVKYVGMLIVNDYRRFLDRGSNVHAHTATLINQVQDLYDDLNDSPLSKYQIKVQIVSMISFPQQDPWNTQLPRDDEGSVLAATLNTKFDEWISSKPGALHGLVMGKDYAVAHLMTGHDLQGYTVGVAYRSGSCRSSGSTAVNQAVRNSDHLIATTIAHELAHNLGVRHTSDSEANSAVPVPCADEEKSYIMDSAGAGETSWSDCSPKWMQMHFEGFPFGCKGSDCIVDRKYNTKDYSSCMESPPRNQWTPAAECGNGVREGLEECDCGLSDCSKVDPCCDGSTCKLKKGSSCSALDTCCDSKTCQIYSSDANVVCRASRGWCDTEEKCNGLSSTCPGDSYKLPGTLCQNPFGVGACFVGICRVYNEQCQSLSGKNGLPNFSDDGCPSAQGDEQCGRLLCQPQDSKSCWHFTLGDGLPLSVDDGTPCGPRNSKVCSRGSCVSPSDVELPVSVLCSNGQMDEGETDVDCGGECFPCSNGQGCFSDSDCFSVPENKATCVFPTIGDQDSPDDDEPTDPPTTSPPSAKPTTQPTVQIPGGLQCYQLKDKSRSDEENQEECELYPQCVWHSNRCKQFGVPPQTCEKVRAGWKCRRYFDCNYDDENKVCYNRFTSKRSLLQQVDDQTKPIADSFLSTTRRSTQTSARVVRGVCQSQFSVNPDGPSSDIWTDFLIMFGELGSWIQNNLQISIPLIAVIAIIVFVVFYKLSDYCCCCFMSSAKPVKTKRKSATPPTSATAPQESNPAAQTTSAGARASVPPRTSGQVSTRAPTRQSSRAQVVQTSAPRASNSVIQTQNTQQNPIGIAAVGVTAGVATRSRNARVKHRCQSCAINYGSEANFGLCNSCANKLKLKRQREALVMSQTAAQSTSTGNRMQSTSTGNRMQSTSTGNRMQSTSPSNTTPMHNLSNTSASMPTMSANSQPHIVDVRGHRASAPATSDSYGIRVRTSAPEAVRMSSEGIRVATEPPLMVAQVIPEDDDSVDGEVTTRAVLL